MVATAAAATTTATPAAAGNTKSPREEQREQRQHHAHPEEARDVVRHQGDHLRFDIDPGVYVRRRKLCPANGRKGLTVSEKGSSEKGEGIDPMELAVNFLREQTFGHERVWYARVTAVACGKREYNKA